MKIQTIVPRVLALGLFAGVVSGAVWAQTVAANDTPGVAPPAAAASDATKLSATTDAAKPADAPSDSAAGSQLVDSQTGRDRADKAAKKAKDAKGPYTGTWEVVVLPPAPLLDHEGKQRVDPDGNLMFNKPLQQMRDKKGHPVFDENDKPIFQTATDLGYDIHGKKISAEKVKPPKMTPMSISDGMLTVDGWTGKARLNYDIADLKYLYLYTPGIGTTIVSLNPFPGATQIPGAFNNKSLKLTVDGHPIELSSSKPLLDKGKKPEAAWVVVDREYTLPVKAPVLGYGTTTKFPYAWPGSKSVASTGSALAPPLPVDVRPDLALAACPRGMMRPTGAGRLPGQKAVDEPCVPISASGTASATAVTASN